MQYFKPRLFQYRPNHRGRTQQNLTFWNPLPGSGLHYALCAAVCRLFKHHSFIPTSMKVFTPYCFPKEISLQLILQSVAPVLAQCLHTKQTLLSFTHSRILPLQRPCKSMSPNSRHLSLLGMHHTPIISLHLHTKRFYVEQHKDSEYKMLRKLNSLNHSNNLNLKNP